MIRLTTPLDAGSRLYKNLGGSKNKDLKIYKIIRTQRKSF